MKAALLRIVVVLLFVAATDAAAGKKKRIWDSLGKNYKSLALDEPWCEDGTNPDCRSHSLQYKCAVAFANLTFEDTLYESQYTRQIGNTKYTFIDGVIEVLQRTRDEAAFPNPKDDADYQELVKELKGKTIESFEISPANAEKSCNDQKFANSRCYVELRNVAETEFTTCQSSALNDNDDYPVGQSLCDVAAFWAPNKRQWKVELHILYSVCGSPWQLVTWEKPGVGDVPFRANYRMCCAKPQSPNDFPFGRMHYRSCRKGGAFAQRCA